MTLSLFVRRTCITFWHVERKFPSIPLTSIAFTSILVRRKGTCVKVRPQVEQKINWFYGKLSTTEHLLPQAQIKCHSDFWNCDENNSSKFKVTLAIYYIDLEMCLLIWHVQRKSVISVGRRSRRLYTSYLFRKLFPVHWSFKAISKIYVQYLPTENSVNSKILLNLNNQYLRTSSATEITCNDAA